MTSIKALLIAGTLLLTSISLQPVAAQRHDHDGDGYSDHGNGRHDNWKRQEYRKQVRKAQRWQPQNIRGKWRNINWRTGTNSQHQADVRYNLNAGITTASTLLATGINAGQISAAEEIQCRSELERLSNEVNRMSRGGYSSAEYQNLSAAFANLNSLITAAGTNGVNR